MNRLERRQAQFKRGQRYGNDRNHQRANPTAAFAAIAARTPMGQNDFAHCNTEVRTAWYHLCNGTGTTDHFDAVATAMNICLVRSESIGDDAVEVAIRAQAAMVGMQQRFHRCARLGPDADALAHVPYGLDLYDQLLQLSSPLQLQAALTETMHRIANGDVLTPGATA